MLVLQGVCTCVANAVIESYVRGAPLFAFASSVRSRIWPRPMRPRSRHSRTRNSTGCRTLSSFDCCHQKERSA